MLGPRKQQMLYFIRNFIEENGAAPTISIIAAEFGLSKPNVSNHLSEMRGLGLVEFPRYFIEQLRLTKKGHDYIKLLGKYYEQEL